MRQARRPGRDRSPARNGDPLLAIPPRVYVAVLTGREVGRDGKIACPFHPDRSPSLHAYREPHQGWTCFSAKCWRGDRPNGGDIYDLASQLWKVPTRGPDFLQLRHRLHDVFGVSDEQRYAAMTAGRVGSV